MKLTDRTVEAARCPDGRKDALIFDESLKGVRRTAIGIWGAEVTTKQARDKAEALRGQVRDRRDPVSERKVNAAARMAAEGRAKAEAAAAAHTVDVLIGEWTTHHLSAKSVSYRSRVPKELRRALEIWLPAPAYSLKRPDAVKVLARLIQRHSSDSLAGVA